MLLLMRFAYKYRLYPNQAQVRFLENQLLYNAALQERRDAWKVCRKSINYYDQGRCGKKGCSDWPTSPAARMCSAGWIRPSRRFSLG